MVKAEFVKIGINGEVLTFEEMLSVFTVYQMEKNKLEYTLLPNNEYCSNCPIIIVDKYSLKYIFSDAPEKRTLENKISCDPDCKNKVILPSAIDGDIRDIIFNELNIHFQYKDKPTN